MAERSGPLAGVKIIEMTGIGPVPYAGMLLADLGAQVIRIDRPSGYPAPDPQLDFSAMGAAAIFYRSRPLVRMDLKAAAGRDLLLRLAGRADALVEGYRPGVMERLGLGPADCMAANPALAYVRVTGWGQEGPMARMAGHDLNYIGLSGALSLFGRDGRPPVGLPPLVGDMAGGGLFAVVGLLAAVVRARADGRGQVVDASIVDGTASLYALLSALSAAGQHAVPAGGNVLDGGRHFYRTYPCADGGAVAVGAIEPAFRRVLLDRLGLAGDPRFQSGAPEDEAYCTQTLAALFATRPRDHWDRLFHDSDGCVTAILSPAEAAADPRNRARQLFLEIDGVSQAAPAPRFSETEAAISLPAGAAVRSQPSALGDWGISAETLAQLAQAGVLQEDAAV